MKLGRDYQYRTFLRINPENYRVTRRATIIEGGLRMSVHFIKTESSCTLLRELIFHEACVQK